MDWDAKRRQLWDDVEAQLDWMSKHVDALEAENAQLTEQVAELRVFTLTDEMSKSCQRFSSDFYWELHHMKHEESETQLGWKCSVCGHINPQSAHYCGGCGRKVTR